MKKEPLIKLENVSYTFSARETGGAQKQALKNIELEIYPGEYVAILGHNGSGKSTLAKLCNALYEPTEGKVTVNGIPSDTEENGNLIRRDVGMVFQNPDNQLVATVVEDDVAFGPENLGIEPEEIRKRVDEALKSVGMYDERLRQPHTLSGGQKQRIAIAGVIAMAPKCIVLDESTAMLDPLGRREVLETVRRLNKENGITIILITHFMEEAAQADRVIILDDGCIVKDDKPQKIFADIASLHKYGLDAPASTVLCDELGLKKGVLTTDEAVMVIAEKLRRGL